jgi:hypothetical protein
MREVASGLSLAGCFVVTCGVRAVAGRYDGYEDGDIHISTSSFHLEQSYVNGALVRQRVPPPHNRSSKSKHDNQG